MYVHSNLLTSVRTQLKFVLRSIVFQTFNVKKTLHIAVTRPEVMEYLYVKKIVQQFAENAFRKIL